MKFYYVMDPMCAWCFGFHPELKRFLNKHPDSETLWVMGGLAPDNDLPMDIELRETIASYWREIENKTQVSFNHDFWECNTPYRSTYQACRAVIASEQLLPNSSQKMVEAIQAAYYLNAQNPALINTLAECAELLGIDGELFLKEIKSPETEALLKEQLLLSQRMQVCGFPALFYINERHQAFPLTLGYCTTETLDLRLTQILAL